MQKQFRLLSTLCWLWVVAGCGLIDRPLLPTSTVQSTKESTQVVTATTLASAEIQPCSDLYSVDASNEQVSLQGIVPGETTAEQLAEILGEPVQTSSFETTIQWDYPEFTIYFKEGRVDTLLQFFYMEELPISFGKILETYGCPDHIFAVDESQHPAGNYFRTSVVYLNGIEFIFNNYPISFNEPAEMAIIFIQMSLDSFLDKNFRFNNPNYAKATAWEDAITVP